MIDAQAFGLELAEIVKAATAPLTARIAALEKAQADAEAHAAQLVKAMESRLDEEAVEGIVSRALAAVAPTEPADLPERIKAAAVEAVGAIPVLAPELPDVAGMVAEAVSEAVKAIPTPKDGDSVTVEQVLPALEKRVDEYLAALPVPKDGEDGTSVTADDVLPALMKRADEYLATVKPADGIGLAGALIDRDGNLVVTMTNGEAKSLGRVVGEDGKPGEAKDGIDGLGFDDMTLDYDGEREFTFLFQNGERIVERRFTVPVVLDRGVYRPETNYTKGDAVTYGGSVWIAQGDTKDKPDGSPHWRLAVKAGRDGKTGVMKEERKPGPVRIGRGNAD